MSPLLVASLVVFLEGLSFGVLLPVIAPFVRELGGDEAWAGYLFAAATLPRVVFAPFWGRLSDRVGRKPAMAVVALGTTSASLMWGFCRQLDGVVFSGLTWLLLARTLYGIFAAQSVLGMAVASDRSDKKGRASAMGALGAAFGVAFAIGPALGGALTKVIPLTTFGYIAASFQAISLLLILFKLRETRPLHAAEPYAAGTSYPPAAALLRVIATPVVFVMNIVTVIGTAAYSVLFPTLEPLMRDWFNWSPEKVGYLLSAFGFVGAVVQGGLIRPSVRYFGEKTMAVIGLALLAAGLLAVASQPNLTGFYCALLLIAVGTGFSVPTIGGIMSLSVHERDQGAVHGLSQSSTSIGRTIGFAASGWLFAFAAPRATYAFGAILAVVSLVLLLTVKFNPTDHPVESTYDEVP